MSYKRRSAHNKMSTPKINFGPPEDAIDKLRKRLIKINRPTFKKGGPREKTAAMFWEAIEKDIDDYEKKIVQSTPFENTCYSNCSESCIRRFDKAFWAFSTTGFKKRKFISIYKVPIRLLSVLLLFFSGVFRVVRANQDGAASFHGTWINAVNQALVFVILLADGDYIMTIPKIAGFCVALAILYGIITNAGDSGLGL
mgnify:FL=1|jgi:hypothetical protein